MSAQQTSNTKVVLVSGGSRGLGLHFVRHLLDKGCTVATFARSATAATDELSAKVPERFRFLAADARDYKQLGQFVNALARDFGGIDALVNNAAIGQDHLLVHAKAELLQTILQVNIEAPILLTRMVLKHMLLASKGRIVNISSICGARGYTGLTAYSASKGALDAFTRSLAREVGERGILVNSIAPGFFESDMSSVLLPSQLETIKRRTPTGRLSDEEHICQVLDLLLFADTNITGQSLPVDGGITI